jgi:ATP-binding cassette, subfamily B, bacterial
MAESAQGFARHWKVYLLMQRAVDEPTAALDARAGELFKSISWSGDNRVTAKISHRFSTVRMADRITVLQYGLAIEEGTHDWLIAAGGLYADLFTLQAKEYQ